MRLVGTAEAGTGFAAGERVGTRARTDGSLFPAGRPYPAALKAIALPRIDGALQANADDIYRAAVPACDRRRLAALARDAFLAGKIEATALRSCSDLDVGFAADDYLAGFCGMEGMQAVLTKLQRSLPCPPPAAYALLRALLRAGMVTADEVLPALTDSLAACHLVGEKLQRPIFDHDRHHSLSVGIDPSSFDAAHPTVVIEHDFGSPVYDLSRLFDRLGPAGQELTGYLLGQICSRSEGIVGEVSWLAMDWTAEQVGECMQELGASSPDELDGLPDDQVEGVVQQYMHIDAGDFRAMVRALDDMESLDRRHRSVPDIESVLVRCAAAGGLDAQVALITRAFLAQIGNDAVSLSDAYFDYPPLCVVFCPSPLAGEAVDMLCNAAGDAESHCHLDVSNAKALPRTIRTLSCCLKALSLLDALAFS